MGLEEGCCTLFELVNPQLLPPPALSRLIKKRGTDKNVGSLSQEEMIEYVAKYISPKNQRSYRDNRKGRILKRNQIQCLKRAAAAGRATGEPAFKLIKTGESLKPGESRLKPPPKVFCSGDAKNSGPANGTNNGLKPGGGESRLKPPPKVICSGDKKKSDDNGIGGSGSGSPTKRQKISWP